MDATEVLIWPTNYIVPLFNQCADRGDEESVDIVSTRITIEYSLNSNFNLSS